MRGGMAADELAGAADDELAGLLLVAVNVAGRDTDAELELCPHTRGGRYAAMASNVGNVNMTIEVREKGVDR